MDKLVINYNKPKKSKRIIEIFIGAYFAVFSFYFFIIQLLAKLYDALFVCAIIGLVLGLGIILANSLINPKPLLVIDNSAIIANMKGQSFSIDWVNVSEMNIGVSYLLFILNGRNKQNLDLSELKYIDLKEVKSKASELCEFKNIPFKND